MRRYVQSVIIVTACASSLALQAGEVVAYELLPGSLLRDECQFCDRIPIVRPITGTFGLEAGEPVLGSVSFTVHDIDFQAEAGDYAVTGKGVYHYLVLAEPLQEMELDITVNGTATAHLVSGGVPMERPWPLIQITVKEEKPQDPDHVYTLEIFAAPAPVAWKTYALGKDSELVDDCTICGKPTIPVPITGTFALGELPGGVGLYYDYVLGAINFKSADPERPYVVSGGGFYRQGGEVAVTQLMALVITVNETTGIPVESGYVTVPVPFPAIEITLMHVNPPDPFHVYSLKIIAKPGEPLEPLFRRGDMNADAQLNIADAVFLLGYLFAQKTPPPCMDAADANDDGKLDISDAIKALAHLFGNAGPLPTPFEVCGSDPTPDAVVCERFVPCE